MLSKLMPYLLTGISVGGQYALIAIGYHEGEAAAPKRKDVQTLLSYR